MMLSLMEFPPGLNTADRTSAFTGIDCKQEYLSSSSFSHSFISSMLPVARRSPSARQSTQYTLLRCPESSVNNSPLSAFHSRTHLSLLPVAMIWLPGFQATTLTWLSWSCLNIWAHSPVWTFHTRALSSAPLAKYLPSSLQATEKTQPLWPSNFQNSKDG